MKFLKRAIADGGWVAGTCLALWAYWALYSIVTPVTVWDAHTYNLARLELFRIGGFWKNDIWNTERQISFPWAFDAVHLSFLRIGAGVALPSFACFTGLLWIVHTLIARYHTRHAAWDCCLGLLALPTFVYQATSTKNDLAVVFALACWFYALCEYRRTGRRLHLGVMAVSLAFAAGAKSTGIPLSLLAGLLSLIMLRRDPGAMRWLLMGFPLSIVLVGSIETYVNNFLLFGSPLGSRSFLEAHRNRDGLGGAIANMLRYLFGNLTTGLEPTRIGQPIAGLAETTCRMTLHALGLADMGYRPGFTDANFMFPHGHGEAAADYGPLGTLAVFTVVLALIRKPARDPVFLLSLTSFASLSIVGYAVAWMPWNNRFLMLPMAAATTAFMLSVSRGGPYVRRFALILATLSAVLPILVSYNRKPTDLYAALVHRKQFSLKENVALIPVISDVRARVATGECSELVVNAGGDAWILPFFSLAGLTIHPEPVLSRTVVSNPAYEGAFVLLIGKLLPDDVTGLVTMVAEYREAQAQLYRIGAPR